MLNFFSSIKSTAIAIGIAIALMMGVKLKLDHQKKKINDLEVEVKTNEIIEDMHRSTPKSYHIDKLLRDKSES